MIVHNAGLCDDDYLLDQKRLADLPRFKEKGDKIKIDDRLTGNLLAQSYIQSRLLITLVDIWIRQN